MTITNSTFSNNSHSGSDGSGAITNSAGTVNISGSNFVGNSTNSQGGAILNGGGFGTAVLVISNSSFSGNSAGNLGGAIHNGCIIGSCIAGIEGITTITDSTFSGNSSASGGAIANNAGIVDIITSNLSGNIASSGAAIHTTATTSSSSTTYTNNDCVGVINDNGGNLVSNSPGCPGTVVDTTPPTIDAHGDETAEATSAAGAVVNYISPSTFDVVDGVGVASCTPASGSQFALGDTLVTCSASDAAGNIAIPTTFTVHVVDTTPPTVNVTNIVIGTVVNSAAIVTYSASASDLVDGAVATTCSPSSGSSFPVGLAIIHCSATDTHLNTGVGDFGVVVGYNFTGFFSPVDNIPTVNIVRAGRAIPIKFSLNGDQGLNIFASAPISRSVDCNTQAPTDFIEVTINGAGSSSLTYDPSTDQYIYVWKTERTWTGCRELVIRFADGSTQTAIFRFTSG